MLPYARFLHDARYNVLLYDSRGVGESGGFFSLGSREVRDVEGAIAYVQRRPALHNHRCGLLGVSLGAGIVISVAASMHSVLATVADSAYVNQHRTVERLDILYLDRLQLSLAPFAPWAVDRLLGERLSDFSPVRAVSHIAPRALLLIHSRNDANPTTPLSGAVTLYRMAGQPTYLWIAPHGGHAGAFAAQPAQYSQRVIAFFRRYLLTPPKVGGARLARR